VHEEVFKKLGVKSLKEVRKKKLRRKYDIEMKKRLIARKLEHPRLIAVDEKGKVLKEIQLGTEKEKIKIRDEYNKRDRPGEQEVWRIAFVSDNRMFGVVVITSTVRPLYTEEDLKGSTEGIGEELKQQSRITVFDNKGEVLYEKDYNDRTVLGGPSREIAISDNGTVAVVTSKGIFGGGWPRLHVYDKNGKGILTYPKQVKDILDIRDITISPNGKYVAVKIIDRVFFNTSTGARWKADKPYIVREISNSGIARIDITETIDLKEHLGE
jgi:hypothetical protein